MKLTSIEKETIINFNEGELAVNVYTYNPRLRRRLRNLKEQQPDEVTVNYDGDYSDYDLPKSWIRINPPRRVAPLSEEQRRNRITTLHRVTGNE